jgi:MFS family permease
LALIGDVILIFSHQFGFFAIAIFFASLQMAMFSGTDEAIIYDSAKELGNEDGSLKHLGNYFSSRNILKIIFPLIAVLIIKNLSDWQFIILILIDIIAGIGSLLFALFILEPKHYFKVEEQEGHILTHAIKLLRSDRTLLKAILTRTIVFIAMFIIWRFHQDFLLRLGFSVVSLGVMWAAIQFICFLANKYLIAKFPQTTVMHRINDFNFFLLIFILLEVFLIYFHTSKWYIMVFMALIFLFEQLRWPLYSQLYNQKSASFNRATTLSLSNFLKSILDLPLLFVGSILVGISPLYPFVFSLLLVFFVYVGAKFNKRDTCTT